MPLTPQAKAFLEELASKGSPTAYTLPSAGVHLYSDLPPELGPEVGEVTVEDFSRFFQMQVSTVTVITANEGKQRAGLTATAVCSLSNSPPSAVVSLSKNSNTIRLVRAARHFGVNILHEDQDDVAKAFSQHAVTEEEIESKFQKGGRWVSGAFGVPTLEGALATLVCDVLQIVEFHTHAVVFGQAREVTFPRAGRPLLYGFKRFCSVLPSSHNCSHGK